MDYQDQLYLQELCIDFESKLKKISHRNLCKLSVEILNYLNFLYKLPSISVDLSYNEDRWALYNPFTYTIEFSSKTFIEPSHWVIEILFHEWAHHWQAHCQKINFIGNKYSSSEEYDRFVHGQEWEDQVNYLLQIAGVKEKMDWIPTFRRVNLNV